MNFRHPLLPVTPDRPTTAFTCYFVVDDRLCLIWQVAPNGKADNTGSEASPFGTLAQARDAIRKLRNLAIVALISASPFISLDLQFLLNILQWTLKYWFFARKRALLGTF